MKLWLTYFFMSLIVNLWLFGTIATGEYIQTIFPIAALIALYITYNDERKRSK